MATYKSVTEYADALKAKLSLLDKAFGRAVASVHAEQMVRIFQEGERGSGGKIGTYNSTNPLYVNPLYSPKKFPAKGKPPKSETKFKNGKPHKTGYFSSYKTFRDSQGRQSAFVDLKLSGQFQSDLAKPPQQQGETWITGTSNKANTDKLNGAVEKYGADVFKLNQKERDLLVDILQKERAEIGI